MALLNVLRAVPGVVVAGICDINATAPGLELARSMAVATYPDVYALVRGQPVDWLINVSHTSLEQRLLLGKSLQDVTVIDGDIGEFVWRILNIFASALEPGGMLEHCPPDQARLIYALVWRMVSETADIARQAYEHLANIAFHDPLTALYTRRFLLESMDREIANTLRNGQPLALILADLDHFKAVNDRFGHEAGDEMLRHFASLFQTNCRHGDIASRYGGEEFALVLPGTSRDHGLACAERLRVQAEQELTRPDGRPQTASMGMIVLAPRADIPKNLGEETALRALRHEIFRLADEALYRAKREGRNRVVIFEATVTAQGIALAR